MLRNIKTIILTSAIGYLCIDFVHCDILFYYICRVATCILLSEFKMN